MELLWLALAALRRDDAGDGGGVAVGRVGPCRAQDIGVTERKERGGRTGGSLVIGLVEHPRGL